MSSQGKDPTVGTLLAVFLGGFGAHRFYLNDNRIGLIYLIFFWTLIPSLLGLAEAFFMPGRVREYNTRSELILPEARICRYCKSDLTWPAPNRHLAAVNPAAAMASSARYWGHSSATP